MQDFYVKDLVVASGGTLLCGDENIRVDSVSTDSKHIGENCLFVPIIGERVDAHNFIDDAINAGAVCVLTSEHDEKNSDIPYIRVTNTTMALQEIGKFYGKSKHIPMVGVTGSVGKTTTKEMIAKALSAGLKTFKTSGNNNSQIGVPLTLLKMTNEDEIAVIEMGMSMKGEMERLATLVTLDAAVVTNIGVSHIEQLKTQDGICEEKFHIADALESCGIMFLNGDDPIIQKHRDSISKSIRVITFGISDTCNYRAVDIESDGENVFFNMVISGKIDKHPVKLKVPGMHNVRNALAALAVANKFKVPLEAAIEALSEYEGVAMRQQITKVDGFTVIDDSYNASPDSMKAGIDVLAESKTNGRKFAVLADMLELGEDAPKYHYEIGEYIADKVDELIVFGELSENIAKAVTDKKSSTKVCIMDDRKQINDYLNGKIKSGDIVLFKGSRGMKLNECVDIITRRVQ